MDEYIVYIFTFMAVVIPTILYCLSDKSVKVAYREGEQISIGTFATTVEAKWNANYEPEKEIKIDDILVIRGKGKFKIKNIEGVTKKGKIISIVEHYI